MKNIFAVILVLVFLLAACSTTQPTVAPAAAVPQPTAVSATALPQPTAVLPTAMPQPTAVPATAVSQPTAATPPTPPAPPSPLAASCPLRLATVIGPEYAGVVHTTSATDEGLFTVFLGGYEQEFHCKVNVIAFATEKATDMAAGANDFFSWKGSITISKEQSLDLAREGKVDALFLHENAQTDQFLKDGDAASSVQVMYGDYVIVGPKDDPAKVGDVLSARDAFKRIAATQSPFVSRGDGSETNVRELSIWASAGISPTKETQWYSVTGKDMDKTLAAANERRAYTLVNRIACMGLCTLKTNLRIVYGGATIRENKDKALYDHYVVMVVNPAKHPGVNADMAQKLAQWFISPDIQLGLGTPISTASPNELFIPDVNAVAAAFPTGRFQLKDTPERGLQFNKDGTFNVWADGSDIVDGTYGATDKVYTETSNTVGCPSHIHYSYTFDGANLKFTPLDEPAVDACTGRKGDFNNSVTWVLMTK